MTPGGDMITSTTNPLVKDLVRLRSRRHRDAKRRFLIEGRREATAAVAAGVTAIVQVVAPALGGIPVDPTLDTVEMGEEAFRKLSGRQSPDGVMVVAAHLDTDLERTVVRPGSLFLVVEAVEKPGNLGAMLRTADAVGIDGVILTDAATDVHNPNVVRASQGALFSVHVAVVEAPQLIAWLDRHGVSLAATTPDAGSLLWDVDLTGSVAVAVGAEATGLSDALLDVASTRIRVPMAGMADSLNASVTAAVLLYEAARQRWAAGP